MNYRGQPTEQTGFADCGYFECTSSAEFAPVPSPVVTAPQLLIDPQLAQVLLPQKQLLLLVRCVAAEIIVGARLILNVGADTDINYER